VEYLASQYSGELRADRLELMEGPVGVDTRGCYILNNGVALRLRSGDHLENQLKAMEFPLDLRLFPAALSWAAFGAFTAAIVAQLGLLSALWLIGLVAVCEIVQVLNPFSRGRTVS
jgi:hypothetical protein